MRIPLLTAVSATLGSVYGAIVAEHSPQLNSRARLMENLGKNEDYNLVAFIEAAPEDLFEEAMRLMTPDDIRHQLSRSARKIFDWKSNGAKDLVLNLMNRLAYVLHFEHPSYSRDDPESFLERIHDFGLTKNLSKLGGGAPAFVEYFSRWISEYVPTSSETRRCDLVELEFLLFRPYLYPRNPLTTALSFECKIRSSQGIKDARQKLDELCGSKNEMSEEEYGKFDSVLAGFLEHPAFTREVAINLDCSDLRKMSEYMEEVMLIHGVQSSEIDTAPSKTKSVVTETESERHIKRKWTDLDAKNDVSRPRVQPLPSDEEDKIQAAGKITVEVEQDLPTPEVLPLPAVKDFLLQASLNSLLTAIFFDALPEAIVREGFELESIRANDRAIHSFLDFCAARVLDFVNEKYSATAQYLIRRIVELLHLGHPLHVGRGLGESWIKDTHWRYTSVLAYSACKASQFVEMCVHWLLQGSGLEPFFAFFEFKCFQPFLYPRNPLTKVMSLDCKLRFAQVGEHSREHLAPYNIPCPQVSDADAIRLNTVFSRFLSHPAFNLEIATNLDCSDPFHMAGFMEKTMKSYQGDPNQHIPVIAVDDTVTEPSLEVMEQLKEIIREYEQKVTKAAEESAATAKKPKIH